MIGRWERATLLLCLPAALMLPDNAMAQMPAAIAAPPVPITIRSHASSVTGGP